MSVQTFGERRKKQQQKNLLEEQSCSSTYPPPPPPCFSSRSNPPLDMLPLCSATLTSRLVPLLPGRPRRAPDNGMNVATLKPPEVAGRKHRSVLGGAITLCSPVNLSEERGLWVYGPIWSPFLEGGGGHRRDVRTSVWNKVLSSFLALCRNISVDG